MSEIAQAILEHDFDTVLLLGDVDEASTEILMQTDGGEEALEDFSMYAAALRGDAEDVYAWVDRGLDVNIGLEGAVRGNHPDMIIGLINMGAGLGRGIRLAIQQGNYDLAIDLIGRARGGNGGLQRALDLALKIAVEENDPEMVAKLIRREANVDSVYQWFLLRRKFGLARRLRQIYNDLYPNGDV